MNFTAGMGTSESKCHGANQDTTVILFCVHSDEERQMYYFIRGTDSFATIGKKVLNSDRSRPTHWASLVREVVKSSILERNSLRIGDLFALL